MVYNAFLMTTFLQEGRDLHHIVIGVVPFEYSPLFTLLVVSVDSKVERKGLYSNLDTAVVADHMADRWP